MNKTLKTTIVMTGGGTGGHLTPLRFLAQELRHQAPHAQLVYIGTKREKLGHILEGNSFDHQYNISAGKWRRYPRGPIILIQNLVDLLRLGKGIYQSWRLLGKLKPGVVFSKGGFVALPVAIAAKWRGVPVITHDSDSVPGLANRIIARWAVCHATGLPAELYLSVTKLASRR